MQRKKRRQRRNWIIGIIVVLLVLGGADLAASFISATSGQLPRRFGWG